MLKDQKILKILKISLVFLFLIFLFLFFSDFWQRRFIQAEPWWNSDWQYRRPVEISWADSPLSNYQVRISLNTQELIAANKMQPDCDDLRLIDSDDQTQLSFWINNLEPNLGCNSTGTEIWTKVPSIPGNKTIYIYYGNPAATATSSFENTFPNRLEESTTTSGTQNYDAVKLIGKTITITAGSSLTINARYIYVDSTSQINGNEKGLTGGASVGCANGNSGAGNDNDGGQGSGHSCSGAGCTGSPYCRDSTCVCTGADDGRDGPGGGGGGSGGAGGKGGGSWTGTGVRPGCGGTSYGSAIDETFFLGAGGGSGTGSCYSGNHGTGGAGGRGGGALKLNALKIFYTGGVYLNGQNGANGNCTNSSYGCGGGGGGAGGQMVLKGRILNLNNGTFEAKGGRGGARSQSYGGAGGGGGGGRIKIFYEILTESGTSYNVSGGASGGDSYTSPAAEAGAPGTTHKATITYPAPTTSVGEEQTAIVPTITVGTTGNQVATMNIPSADNYLGGAFTFIRNIGSANVTQIIVTETGTVNANLNLSNLKLYYETTANCSFEGDEALFGQTPSFNTSEKATVSGTMTVGTSQVCVYVVLDVGPGAAAGETLEIEISNPSTEITVSAGEVEPTTPVAIAGATTLQFPPASWKAAQDTTSTAVVGEVFRLRVGIGNSGAPALNYDYLLEYAQKVGDVCGDDESFLAMPIDGGPLEMATSTYVSNGDPTTNANKLSTPEGYTFVSGKIVTDPFNSSGAFTLGTYEYTHFEFVLKANAIGTYCLRVTDNGIPFDEYSVYPEIEILP